MPGIHGGGVKIVLRKPCAMCGAYMEKREGGKMWAIRTYCSRQCYYEAARSRRREETGNWRGDQIGNSGVHERLRRYRGRPHQHRCVECGAEAQDWAFRWDRAESFIESDHGPYSTNLADYDPMCRRCHIRFDSARITYLRICPECGTEFVTNNSTKIRCGGTCNARASRRRRREAVAA